MDSPPRGITTRRRFWLAVFALISLGVMAGGLAYYRYEKNHIRQEKYQELATIAQLKVQQIVDWRKERLDHAHYLSRDPFLGKTLAQWLRDPGNPTLRAALLIRLKAEIESGAYTNVLLLAPDGHLLLSARLDPAPLSSTGKLAFEAAMAGRQAVMGDLFRCSKDDLIRLDVAAPILDPQNRPLAAVVLRVNANRVLYPLIQSWPTPSLTAETLLVERKGQDILYLNELRHRKNTALSLANPSTRTELPGVQAALGKPGIFEGRDYRGQEVLADLRSVPQTPWYMVAKVDRAEIMAEGRYRAKVVILFVDLFILLTAVAVVYGYRQRQVDILQNLYRTELERRQAHEVYQTTLYSVGDAVITTDTTGGVKQMNPVAERLIGWPEAEAQGRPLGEVFRIFNEESRNAVENPVNRVLKEGRVVGPANHSLLIARDGTEVPIAYSAASIRDESGAVIGVVLVFRDQTQERAAEKALRESEEKYRLLVNQIPAVVYQGYADGSIDFFDNKVEDLTGYRKEDFDSRTVKWLDLIIKEDLEEAKNKIREALHTGKSYVREYRIRRKDGAVRWIQGQGKIFCNAPGKIDYIKGVLFDVTEQRQSEQALKLLHHQNQLILDSAAEGILGLDSEGKHIFVNPAAVKMLGHEADDLIGSPGHPIWHHTRADGTSCPEEQCLILQTLKSKVGMHSEEIFWRKDGSSFPVEVRSNPLVDDGKGIGAVVTFKDITERKRMEGDLRISHRFLEIAHNQTDTLSLLRAFVSEIKEITGCEAVGIRVLDAAGGIPFEAYDGFSQQFYESESPLSIGSDRCMCINVIKGDYDPKLAFYTPGGSFYVNGTTRFLATVSEEEKRNLRNACHEEGYESVALIPFPGRDRVLGLIHMADRRENMVSLELVEMLEKAAMHLGTAFERIKAEEALRDNEQFLTNILDNIPDGLNVLDPDFKLIRVNRTVENLPFTKPLVGRKCYEVFHGRSHPCEVCAVRQVFRTGQTAEKEYTLKLADGSLMFFEFRAFPLVDHATGQVQQVIEYVRDVSKRKQAEEALRQTSETLQNLINVAPLAIYVFDPEGRVQLWNQASERIFGWSREEALGRLALFIPEDKLEEFDSILRRSLKGEPSSRIELTCRKKDGSPVEISLRTMPLNDAHGKVTAVMSISADITERKQAERSLSEQFRFLQHLIDTIPSPIFYKDANGVYLGCNQSLADFLGRPKEEIIGKTVFDIYPQEQAEKYFQMDQELLQHPGTQVYDFMMQRADGAIRNFIFSKATLIDSSGKVAALIGAMTDITERKQAEESLRQAEEKYRSIFANAVEGIFQSTPEGRYIGANPAMARMFGYESPEELMADITDIATQVYVDPQRRADFRRLMAKDGFVKDFEYQIHRKGGGSIWLSENARAVLNEKGDILYFEGFMQDISERKEAENKLARLRHHQELILNSAWEGILGLDLKGRITFANLAAARMFGYGAEELLGCDSHSAWHHSKPDGSPYPARKCRLHLGLKQGEAIYGAEDVFWRQDGTSFPVKYSLAPILEHGEIFEVTGGVLTFFDLSQQKEEQALTRSLIDASQLCIYLIQDRKIVLSNQCSQNITGYNEKELLTMDFWKLVHPEDRNEVRTNAVKMLRGESSTPYEYRIITKGGESKWIMETVTSVMYQGKRATLGHSMDITPHKELEAQFFQAQKMEAVGRLAGGVAHDFNNMLAVIMGYTEMMQFGLGAESPLRRQAATIKEAAERAASLTRQLLVFSRKQVQETQVLNLNTVISDLDKMLHRLIGEDIDLSIERAPDLLLVKADPAQIEQVIMNLVVNARDALPHGGRITISTAKAFLDKAYARKHPDVTLGSYVVIVVRDNGVGMDAETKSHIFEPFFTTKEMGKGTGLGLSTVYGIVKQSQGTIEVSSESGIGSTFKIYLPRVQADFSRAETPAPAEAGLQGTETILVAEDEKLLRDLICETLKRHGYAVLEAKNGEAALALGEGHQGPIHLMLTDVVMPDLSGYKLAERLAPRRPEMKVVLMSGYTEDVMIQHGVLADLIHFLKKPFTTNVLLKKVRQLLDTTLED